MACHITIEVYLYVGVYDGRLLAGAFLVFSMTLSRISILDGLVNVGIDETNYRKGYRYTTVIVNYDTMKGIEKSILEMQ